MHQKVGIPFISGAELVLLSKYRGKATGLGLRKRVTFFSRGLGLLEACLSGVGTTGVCGGVNEPSCTSCSDSCTALVDGGLWYVCICSSMLRRFSSL